LGRHAPLSKATARSAMVQSTADTTIETERIMDELRGRLANLVDHIAGIMVRL
jgi:hypothetical protein